jgi:hypothetical protein
MDEKTKAKQSTDNSMSEDKMKSRYNMCAYEKKEYYITTKLKFKTTTYSRDGDWSYKVGSHQFHQTISQYDISCIGRR